MHLHFTALKIDGAQIILDRRAFRKIETHHECRNYGVRPCVLLDGALVHLLESEFNGFLVFPVQYHLPHLRKYVRGLGSLKGPLPRHKKTFVAEKDLLRVRTAYYLDIHVSIAGGESLAERRAGNRAAEASPRYDPAPEPFFERHRRDLYFGRQARCRIHRRLGRELAYWSTADRSSRQALAGNVSRFCRGRTGELRCTAWTTFASRGRLEYLLRTGQSNSRRCTRLQEISPFHSAPLLRDPQLQALVSISVYA